MRTSHVKHIGPLVLLCAVLLVGCTQTATPTPAAPTQAPTEPTDLPTAVPTQAGPENLWEVVTETRADSAVRMGAFFDDKIGFWGGQGAAGQAHYTTDGGQTWTLSETSTGCLYSFDIVDIQTVWQCGQRDIKVSTDGGQTWEGTGVAPGRDCTVSFADAETGWVFGPLGPRATTDGGQTWNEIVLPEGVERATAISLRKADEGYLLTPDAALYVTRDGGEGWSLLPLDLASYEGMSLLPSNLATAAIRFFDADNGVVVLSLVGGGQSKVVALRTTDGGQTWEEEAVPAEVGVPYLTRDGRFLTIHSLLNAGKITVLEYQGG